MAAKYFIAFRTEEKYTLLKIDEDGYFVGTVPQLQGCHTQAKSLDKLMQRMKEAVQLCLEASQASR